MKSSWNICFIPSVLTTTHPPNMRIPVRCLADMAYDAPDNTDKIMIVTDTVCHPLRCDILDAYDGLLLPRYKALHLIFEQVFRCGSDGAAHLLPLVYDKDTWIQCVLSQAKYRGVAVALWDIACKSESTPRYKIVMKHRPASATIKAYAPSPHDARSLRPMVSDGIALIDAPAIEQFLRDTFSYTDAKLYAAV